MGKLQIARAALPRLTDPTMGRRKDSI